MSSRSVFLASLILPVFSVACAHQHAVQGYEQKSEIPEGLRVTIGGAEVKEGDRIRFFNTTCKKVGGVRSGTREVCRDDNVGEGTVLKVLDHDSAIVRPDDGVKVDEETEVEKL